jgi:hypothetical protein
MQPVRSRSRIEQGNDKQAVNEEGSHEIDHCSLTAPPPLLAAVKGVDDDINYITNECESSGYRQPFEKMFLRRRDVVPGFFLRDIPRRICYR